MGTGTGTGKAPRAKRETRARVDKTVELQKRLHTLEEENRELRLQLKVGKAATAADEQERAALTQELRAAVAAGVSDEQMSSLLKTFVVKFFDYGEDRNRTLERHLDQLERLLRPTTVTKMVMWTLHQDEDFFAPRAKEAPESLWNIICRVIDASPQQQEEFKMYRENAHALTRGLRFTHHEIEDLRTRVAQKNKALADEMRELQDILTPIQLAKFIVWCADNPASMSMLNMLWASAEAETGGPMSVASSSAAAAATTTSSTSGGGSSRGVSPNPSPAPSPPHQQQQQRAAV